MSSRILRSTALFAALLLSGAARPPRRGRLLWPLPEDRGLTSSFGDLRGNHLHAGLDLSTGGDDGLPVRAVDDGEIVRLKVEWRGYGNAIYVRHAGGDESVYGHLQQFENDRLHIEDLVRRVQREKGTRYPGNIEVVPPVPVRRGDLLAYSGESGTGLPHLHFEWRARDGTEPIPPFLAGLPASAIRPAVEIDEVFVTPEGQLRVAAFSVSGEHRLGLSRLEVRVDGRSYYSMNLRRMDFTNYLLPGGLYDLVLSESKLEPVHSLDPIGASLWPGQVVARKDSAPLRGRHRVAVEAFSGNDVRTRWKGVVTGPVDLPADRGPRENRLALETPVGGLRLDLPGGTLHPGTPVELVSDSAGEVRIEPRSESALPGARLVWAMPGGRATRRLGIYRVTAAGALQSTGSTASDQVVTAPIVRFGRYVLREDDKPPTLSRLRRERCYFGPCLRVDVSDELSGLTADSVVFELPGGQEIVAEVDPDRGWATIPAPLETPLSAVRVRATDSAGNRATLAPEGALNGAATETLPREGDAAARTGRR